MYKSKCVFFFLVIIYFFVNTFKANAQVPYMVKDINPTASQGSHPYDLTSFNGNLFFVADDGIHGYELWKTDGTTAGTVLVKDILVGAGGGYPLKLKVVNGVLYFVATDGINGQELWKTNGTAAGTVMVKDIAPGAASSNISEIIEKNLSLFFLANDNVHGKELWKSDGTTAGTVLAADIYPGPSSSEISNLTNFGALYFFARGSATENVEFWKSDGTQAGTFLLKDLSPNGSLIRSDPSYLTVSGGLMYFVAGLMDNNYNNPSRTLWKSDGTFNGTVVVVDNPASPLKNPSLLTDVNGVLFFSAFKPSTNSNVLWRTDGTEALTFHIAGPRNPEYLTNLNGALIFAAEDDINGVELWKSNGSSFNTGLLKDIYPGITGSFPSSLKSINNVLYFQAWDGLTGSELWNSNGTSSGTNLVKDITPGIESTNPNSFNSVNGKIFFVASTRLNNFAYWKEIWSFSDCNNISNPISNVTNVSFNHVVGPPFTAYTCRCDVFNNLIETVSTPGILPNPVTGNINSKVWIEATQPTQFVKRHYEITPENSSPTATGLVRLYFTQAEFDAFNAVNSIKLPTSPTDAAGIANIRIEKRGGTSSDGTGLPGSYSGAIETINPNTAFFSNIHFSTTLNCWSIEFRVIGFSGFFIKTLSASLPIGLKNLSVEKQGNGSKLTWETITEYNSKGFEVQRSYDGINFEPIYFTPSLAPNGNSNTSLNYVYYDEKPLKALNFFRLKQIDRDGQFTYSSIVKLSNPLSSFSFNTYPNPFTKKLTVLINAPKDDTIILLLMDVVGKILVQKSNPILKGNNTIDIELGNLQKGVYFLKSVTLKGNVLHVQKLVN